MQRSAVSGKLPVNFLSTTYPDDLNDQRRFVQTVHDAIFTDANAVGILSTHKLSATPRMRVLSQILNCFHNSPNNSLSKLC